VARRSRPRPNWPQAKTKKKPGVPPRRGKKLRNHLKNVMRKLGEAGDMPVRQAVAELKKLKRAKFDETVEVHINLGIDPTQSDQMVRGAHPAAARHRQERPRRGVRAGRQRREGEGRRGRRGRRGRPRRAVQKENFLEFDVVLASQGHDGQVSRLGKVLGPARLMPTPKAGTVVPASGDLARWCASSRPARSSTAPTRPGRFTRASAR
jgi:large subunit ribosomal protein L1